MSDNMEFKKSEGEQMERKLMPEGTHVARFYSLIEIGSEDTKWGVKPKIRVGFEFGNEKADFGKEEEQPYVLSRKITPFITSSEGENVSTFTKIANALLGGKKIGEDETVQSEDLLGEYCLVEVKHKTFTPEGGDEEVTYAKMTSFMALPKGTEKPEPVNPIITLEYAKWDQDKFDKLPEFLKGEIQKTIEYQELKGGAKEEKKIEYPKEEGINPSDIPF